MKRTQKLLCMGCFPKIEWAPAYVDPGARPAGGPCALAQRISTYQKCASRSLVLSFISFPFDRGYDKAFNQETWIVRGLALSTLGSVSDNTPSFSSAPILS